MSKIQKKQGRITLLVQDLFLSCLGSLAAFLLVRWVSDPVYGFTKHLLIYLGGALLFSLVGLAVSGASREVSRRASVWNGRRIIVTVLVKEAGLLALQLTGVLGLAPIMILVSVLADIVFSVILMIYPRMIITAIRQEDQEIRYISSQMNTLIYGEDDAALEMAERIDQEPNYNVIGLLTRKPEFNGKVLGNFIIYYAADDSELEKLQWRLGGIDCILFPKKSDYLGPGADNHSRSLESEPSVPDRSHMHWLGRATKRTFDVVFSGFLLIVFSPLIGLCSLAILMEDGKPVLYRQERIGRGGKPFNILKFRTMRVNAEPEGPALYSGNDDPRLTRVGRFLRSHHLDELPQFWNVLVGDMSFIGYRPERRFFIDKIMEVNPRYRYLYQIRPGITSYATLYNGYTDTLGKMLTRLDMDLYYLRNHSVGFDFRILGLTFLSIVTGKKF